MWRKIFPLLDRRVSGGGGVAREVKDNAEEAGMREEVHPNKVTKMMAKPHRVRHSKENFMSFTPELINSL